MSKRRSHKQRGYTLIEILVAGLIMTVLGLGLWTLVRSTYDSQYEILGQNTANSYARQVVDEFADNVRGAKEVTIAQPTEVQFTDNDDDTVRYFLSGGDLRKTVNSMPPGGDVVVLSVQSLAFTYWSYNNGAWASSSAPNIPANVGAVDFTATASVYGSTRQISGSVKIRQKNFQ